MSLVLISASLGLISLAFSDEAYKHWGVATEDRNGGARVVFTLVGAPASPKLPILLLSYSGSWNAMLTWGEELPDDAARLVLSFDGKRITEEWKLTSEKRAVFTTQPERFIRRALAAHELEVSFGSDDHIRRSTFNVAGLRQKLERFPDARKALTTPDSQAAKPLAHAQRLPISR